MPLPRPALLPRPSRPRPAFASRLLLGPLFCAGLLAACNDVAWPDRDPTIVEDAAADSVIAWPPRRYALPGDLVTAEVRGLRTVYTCSRVLRLEGVASDSAGGRFVRLGADVELPAVPDCALSPGLDTAFETAAPAAGRTLFLQTADGRVTDSLRVVAGTGVVEGFLGLPADTLTSFSRYVFRDSTAGHPRRVLWSDSLSTCEVIQAAVFTRRHGGDTLSISVRTLLAAPAPPTDDFPACAAGPRSDTVEVVENRYGWP